MTFGEAIALLVGWFVAMVAVHAITDSWRKRRSELHSETIAVELRAVCDAMNEQTRAMVERLDRQHRQNRPAPRQPVTDNNNIDRAALDMLQRLAINKYGKTNGETDERWHRTTEYANGSLRGRVARCEWPEHCPGCITGYPRLSYANAFATGSGGAAPARSVPATGGPERSEGPDPGVSGAVKRSD
jgi:hypothetical protein